MSTDQQQTVFHPPGVIRLVTPAEHAARAMRRPSAERSRRRQAHAPSSSRRRGAGALVVAAVALLLSGCVAARSAPASLTPRDAAARTDASRYRTAEAGRYARVEEMLAGRVPGLDVLRSASGRYTLRVRNGLSTQRGRGEPLLVVDGLPIGFGADATADDAAADFLSTLAPAEVQRVSLLTDIASIAIYGSRGANGVLLITTRGRAPRHPTAAADSGESRPRRRDLPE